MSDQTRFRVLLAEDEPISRMLATLALEHYGCDVTTAKDGSEAIAAAALHDFDIIFMDYHMPVLDGLQATVVIRQQAALSYHHVPIIAITASAYPSERKACLDAGMDDVLVKPFRLEELERLLLLWTGSNPQCDPSTWIPQP